MLDLGLPTGAALAPRLSHYRGCARALGGCSCDRLEHTFCPACLDEHGVGEPGQLPVPVQVADLRRLDRLCGFHRRDPAVVAIFLANAIERRTASRAQHRGFHAPVPIRDAYRDALREALMLSVQL